LGKTALIVDDSKSARVVLKRLLETHDLTVDTAESAEYALVYLRDHRPDVIFMDHMMPGMDGFEAVSAIKSNPDTATIPIMMYTSQEGELYVGQARALGAVGVLPKKIEPVEVSKVLTSLRVIGAEPPAPKDDKREDDTTASSGEYAALETLDHDLRVLIKDLFAQQRAVLRQDLQDGYVTIASRVADEIRPSNEEPAEESNAWHSELELPKTGVAGISIALLVLAIVASLYWQRGQELSELQSQHALLQQEIELQRISDDESTQLARRQIDAYQQSNETMFAAALAGLEWGANQAPHYTFEERPLGDVRLAVVEQLTTQLTAIDFAGLVRIKTHVADFCLSVTGAEGYELAPRELPAIICDQSGFATGEAYDLGLRQSVAFANFIGLADERSNGQIRYEIVSLGNSDPLMAYPTSAENVSAGTWNDIAKQNHRVEIAVLPDLY